MSNTNETIITNSGLRMIETKAGTGKSPVSGQTIKAHYKGYLEDGTVFDSSYDRNQPFTFPVGQGRVIKGWDEAFLSMQKGSKRTLIIPPELGYGAQGAPPKIPGNSILLFDVELIDIN